MKQDMTQDMKKEQIKVIKKDMNLYATTKKLVRNWRCRVLSAVYPSALTGAATQRQNLCANEITAHTLRDYGSFISRLRLVVTMLLLLMLGSGSVWGQEPTGVLTVTEGVPYRIRTSMAEGVQMSTSKQTARQNNNDNSIKTVDYGAKDQIFYFEPTDDKYFLKDASGNYFFVVSGNAYGTSRGDKVNTDKGKFSIETVSGTDYVKLKCAGSGYLVVGRGFVSGSGVNGDGHTSRTNDNTKSIILWKIIPWDPLQDFKVLIDAVAVYKDDNATLSSAYDTALAQYESLNNTYGASEKADLINNSTFITSVSEGISALTSARDTYLASLSSPVAGKYYVKNVHTGNLPGNLLTHSNDDTSATLSSTIGESTLMTLEYADNVYYLKNGDKYMALKGTRANTPGTNYDMDNNVLSIEWKNKKDDNCKLNLKQFGNHRIGIQFNKYQTTNYTGGYLDFGPCTDFSKLYPLRESGISNPYSYWILIPETLQPPIITETDGVVEITSTDEDVTIWYTIDSEFNENNPTDGATEYTGLLDFSSPYTPRDIRAIAISNHIPTLISDVALLQMPRDPISISANDQTIDINSVSTLSYTLSAGEGFVPYDKVYATSGNTSIFTVDSEPFTGGSITLHPVGSGTATLTLTAKKTDGTTDACTTTVSITVSGTVNAPIISSVLADGAATITISSDAEGATIYYTDDGITTPTSGSTLYNAPFTIPVAQLPKTIKAIATKGGITSEVTTQVINAYTQSYVALHQNGAGYLKVKTANVTLDNDDTFRDKDIYSSDGYSIWVRTSDGYLQNGPYYLNVANGQTLYLSVTPVTTWSFTDVPGDTNGKQTVKYENKYLCRDGNTIKLSESATSSYHVCPITLTEKTDSWTGPTNSDVTVQSPQLVTYLRQYFSRKVTYNFVNDAGTPISGNEKDNFVYALLEYNTTNDANKGSTWDIADGIIFNKQSSGNVTVTASYNLLPADLIARDTHSIPVQKDIKLTIQPSSFTPDGSKNYLLFNVTNGDTNNYRYPYDQSTASQGDRVMPNKSKTALTDPATDLNQEISWLIEVDDEGFYSFKNKETGRYIYYETSDYTYTNYGVAKVGATTLPSGDEAKKYKFRLYKTSHGTYGNVFSIIPYEQQFVVFKSDGVSNDIFSSFNIYRTPNAISLWKPGQDASKWKIYTYEAEDRLKSDYGIKMGDNTLQNYYTSETGTYNFTATTYYSRNIKESPVNNRDLEIYNTDGTTTYSKANVTYTWTVTGLDSYTSTTDNSSGGDGRLAVTVNSMPTTTVVGTVSLKAKVDKANTVSNKDLIDNKTVSFSLVTSISSEVISITSLSQITSATGNYKLTADITDASSDAPTFTGGVFSGIFDGGQHTISGLHTPLFASTSGAVVKNVILKNVTISQSGNVGAITGTAGGYTRIYNCGILPSNNLFSEETSTIASTNAYCGGLVGYLGGDSRVVNCYSYATITGGTTVGGIVGYNENASDFSVTSGQYANLKTMVVNCMFYGDILGGTNQYGVYGGQRITNDTSTGINNYNYFRSGSKFTATNGHKNTSSGSNVVGNPTAYNCSFPAEERYLTQVEFHRSLLNSNRELCGWWVGSDLAPSTLTTAQVQAIPKDASLIYKWVVDPNLAPYPILKPFGKYNSVINNPGNQTGNSLSVTVQSGSGSSAADKTISIPITNMDPQNHDYGYYKIQLPYFNTVFGDPDGADWATKYAGNYTDKVVTGWKIKSVTGGTQGSFVANWESGYNFADRKCTDKDKFDVSGRVFAQGGYYYVPDDVTAITIEAYWGKAIYIRNNENSYDRVNITLGNTGSSFAPAGTRGDNINGATVETSIRGALTNTNINAKKTVYDYALVLVGNVQESVGGNDIKYSASDYRGFTIMSVDLDFDEEPDYCLEWQLGSGMGRQVIAPIRFDFLPVVELGIAAKRHNSTNFYSLGCYRSQGHFEVTETAFIHFGQFEFELGTRDEGPIILNGGIYDQYCRGRNGETNQHINYVILGGHVVMPSFTPGAHVHNGALYKTRHCAVNVLGGNFDSFYLTGGYNESIEPFEDNPHCYIDGGHFGTVAAAYKEGISGNVTWRINHALIDEFYGGGVMSQATGTTYKIVKGNIDVVIDNSTVGKYCGGPKFGDMVSGKTVTTSATNTVFTQYFGAGNGGTTYIQYGSTDDSNNGPYSSATWTSTVSGGNTPRYTPGKYKSTDNGYEADYEMEVINTSTGDLAGRVINRSYYYSAQFATTNTGNVTNTLTGCTIEQNFYGGGFLGGVNGNVTSTLTDCTVNGNVFGAGYSASAGTVTIYNTDKTPPTANVYTGIINPQSGGTSTNYYWTHDHGSTDSPITAATETDPKSYYYTEIPLDNLGTVSGLVTLTITGTNEKGSIIGIEGDNTTGHVYGGGDASAVKNTTTPANASTIVNIKGNTEVKGNVFGGGNEGEVTGSATVNIAMP